MCHATTVNIIRIEYSNSASSAVRATTCSFQTRQVLEDWLNLSFFRVPPTHFLIYLAAYFSRHAARQPRQVLEPRFLAPTVGIHLHSSRMSTAYKRQLMPFSGEEATMATRKSTDGGLNIPDIAIPFHEATADHRATQPDITSMQRTTSCDQISPQQTNDNRRRRAKTNLLLNVDTVNLTLTNVTLRRRSCRATRRMRSLS